MGCICSKGKSLDEYLENNNGNRRGKSRKGPKLLGSSSGKEEGEAGFDQVGNDANARLISNQLRADNIGFTPISPFDGERKTLFSRKSTKQNLHRGGITIGSQVSGGHAQFRSPGSFLGTPAREKGVQVVTGWPPWLTAVAGEAISGWVPRKADSFEKLDKIGQGTYSSVYRARDLETSKIVALKKVRFTNMDPESVRFMAREITILRRLDHPNIMKLEGLISSRTSSNLYLVFEYMDHDLAGIASTPGAKLSEAQIKCYMQQLFNGLEHCHSHGILHRDIKGSNLLIDNNGTLKIGDFGLSTFFGSQQKQPLTSRVVTLWYRPPELLLGATDYGVAVDMWSAGCILAELFTGKPIMSGRTEVEQLHKIFKLCGSPSEEYWKKFKLPNATIFKPQQPYKRCFADTYKDIPSSTLKLLDTLLAVEPDFRGTTSSALQSEFFTTKPLPCDPSSLPKYPPSKELDVKLREEEAKRQKAAGGKGCKHESMSKFSRDFKAVPTPASIKHNLPDAVSRFPVKGTAKDPITFGSSTRNAPDQISQRSYMDPGAAQLSKFSNSVAVRGCNNFGDNDSSTKQDQRHHLLNGQIASNKDEQLSGKDSTTGNGKMNRVHYSGPLVPPGGNMDEMLKEHEKQIQNAVRKARQAKKT